MLDAFIQLIKKGVQYVQKHPDLLLSLLLIIIIPFAFLFSGQQFLNASQDNQERLEKDRIGLLHDVFMSLVRTNVEQPQVIQSEIENIATHNPDVTKFRVAHQNEAGEIVIIAALDAEKIGQTEENPETFQITRIHPNESIIAPYYLEGNRHWQAFRLFKTSAGAEYFIFTETSLVQTDALFAARVTAAYYWLFLLLAIVLLLLFRHVRLIDYGYLYRKVHQANQTKDLFTNMIAHELRAPLTAMRGYASMIRENQNLDSAVREQGKRIEDSAERLVFIVSDLLDVARIQSGKLAVQKETVNLSETLVQVAESLTSSAQEKNITLLYTDIPNNITINSDGKRLFQIFTNLISNAIKYTPAGTIEISAEDKKDRIELRVKDTGMGISADDQKKLFAPFFRVDNDEVDTITGTGLGMWITKQLIELLHGSIGVESIKDVGTHIVITLPKEAA